MNQQTPRDIASFPELFDGFDDMSRTLRRFTLSLLVTAGLLGAGLSLYTLATLV